MKTKLVAAAAILSAAAMISWTAPSVLAGHGGGHGGGGFSGGGGSGGGHSYSGGGNYSGGYHSYSGNLRGYTGGGLGRVYSGYSPKYSSMGHSQRYTSMHSNQYRTYSANRSNVYRGSSSKPYSSLGSPRSQRVYRSQPAINRSNRVPNISDTRTLGKGGGKGQVNVATTSLANRKAGDWARNNPTNTNRFDQRTQNNLRNWQGKKSSWAEASQRNHANHGDHNGHHHDNDGHHNHHGHDWWNHHCSTIIWVDWGWWGWWDGWWYPAWGYDPYYSYYAYDGPIYGYGGLPPDEIVANVQNELQRRGYYYGEINGLLNPTTQEALIRYQRDHGLPVTGAVDQETVGALGLS